MNPRATMKLSHVLNSRNKSIQSRFLGENVACCFSLMPSAGISTARQSYGGDGKFSGRIFADYSIFKGKAALSAAPVLPTFSKLESGHTKLERRGVIMLSFRPAIGERKYDSEKKQLFALSVTEVGSFLSLVQGDSCELDERPCRATQRRASGDAFVCFSGNVGGAGQVRKSLSIKPHTDGYFISLSVVNNILKTNERFTVPVTTAEFAVLRSAFIACQYQLINFALPRIMGWAHNTNPPLDTDVGRDSLKAHPQLASTSEWDR